MNTFLITKEFVPPKRNTIQKCNQRNDINKHLSFNDLITLYIKHLLNTYDFHNSISVALIQAISTKM